MVAPKVLPSLPNNFAPPTWIFSQAHPSGVFFFSTGSLMCTTFSTAFPQWMEASKNSPKKYDRIVIACMCAVLQLIMVAILQYSHLCSPWMLIFRWYKDSFLFAQWLLFQCSGFKSLWAGSCHRLQMSGWFSLRPMKNALCHKRPLTSLQLSAVSFVCQIYKGGH